jgi:ribosomal protein L11
VLGPGSADLEAAAALIQGAAASVGISVLGPN